MQDLVSDGGAEQLVILAERADIHAVEAEPPLFVVGDQHIGIPEKFRPVPHGEHRVGVGQLLHLLAVAVEGLGKLHHFQVRVLVKDHVAPSLDELPAFFRQLAHGGFLGDTEVIGADQPGEGVRRPVGAGPVFGILVAGHQKALLSVDPHL